MADPVVYLADFRSVDRTAPYFTFTANCYDGTASNTKCTISINAKYTSPYGPISNSGRTLVCEIWADKKRQTSIDIGPGGAYDISGKTSLDLGTYYYTVDRGEGGTSRNCHIGAYVSLSGILWSKQDLKHQNADTYIATPNIPVEHTCYFNGNGSGSTVTAATAVKVYGKQLSMPSASRPGYNFLGWSTDSDATTAAYPGNSLQWTSDESITYYAVWELSDISWSMDCSSLYDSHTLVWSSDTDEPTIAFSSSTVPTVKFKINTSGTVSNFKCHFLGEFDKSIDVSANTQYTVPFINAIYQLNNQSDKSIVSTSISGSFTISQGSNSFTKTFNRSVSFVIGTAVSDVKANLIYCYKTSATNCKLKYKLTLPMVGDSKFNSSSTNHYTSIMDTLGYYLQNPFSVISSSSTFSSSEGSNELVVDSIIDLSGDDAKSISVYLPKLMTDSPSSAVSILTVNIAPYENQDILLKKDKTVECVEIIETDENEIAFQKGGRLYCKEFIESIGSNVFNFGTPYNDGAVHSVNGFNLQADTNTLHISGGTGTSLGSTDLTDGLVNYIPIAGDAYIDLKASSVLPPKATVLLTITEMETKEVKFSTFIDNTCQTVSKVASVKKDWYVKAYLMLPSSAVFTSTLDVLIDVRIKGLNTDIEFNNDYNISAVEFIEKGSIDSNAFSFGTPYNDGAVHSVSGFNLQADTNTSTLHISGGTGTGTAYNSINLTEGVVNYMPIDGDAYIDLAASSALPSGVNVLLVFTDSETGEDIQISTSINSTNQTVSKVISVKKKWYVRAHLILPPSAVFTSTIDVLISVRVKN